MIKSVLNLFVRCACHLKLFKVPRLAGTEASSAQPVPSVAAGGPIFGSAGQSGPQVASSSSSGSLLSNELRTGTNPWVIDLAFSHNSQLLAVCLLSKTILIPLDYLPGSDILQRADAPVLEVPWLDRISNLDVQRRRAKRRKHSKLAPRGKNTSSPKKGGASGSPKKSGGRPGSAPSRAGMRGSRWGNVRKNNEGNRSRHQEAMHGCLSMDLCRGDLGNVASHLLATTGLGGHVVLHEVLRQSSSRSPLSREDSVAFIKAVPVVYDGTGLGERDEPNRAVGAASLIDVAHVNMVRFSPGREQLRFAAASGDGNCYLYWLVPNSEQRAALQRQRRGAGVPSLRAEIRAGLERSRVVLRQGHEGEVLSVAWSKSTDDNEGTCNLVVTGGKDNVAVVWAAQNGDMLSRLVAGHSRDVLSVCFDPTDTFVVTASDDRRMIVWDALTAEKCGILVGHHTAGIRQAVFRPLLAAHQSGGGGAKRPKHAATSILVSVGADHRVLMWRPGNGLRWKRYVKDVHHKWAIDVTTRKRVPMSRRAAFKPIRTIVCHPTQAWVIFSESADGRVMSSSQTVRFQAKGNILKETAYLAKMDGSPVFCAGEAKLCHVHSDKRSKPARCL